MTRVEHSTGRPAPITVVYDGDGRQLQYGDVETSYDGLGRVATTSNGASGSTTYAYDNANQLTSIGYPKSIVDDLLGTALTVTHKHDADGRITEVATSRGHKATYGYDPEGRETDVTRPDGGVERRTYDAAGQLTTINDTTANGYSYAASHEYTAAGQNRVTNESSNQSGSKLQYSYDAASRLTSNGRGATYGYDPAGNQTTTATPGLGNRLLGDLAPALSLGSYDQVTQKFNEVNELTSTIPTSPLGTSSTFRYDPMGQRLARISKTAGISAGTTSYLWDQAGRLLSVDDSATNENSSYTYDDTGLRATQSRLQLLPNAWDRAGNLSLQLSDGKALYVHGADGLPLLSYKAGLIASVYHHDAQGSTRAVTSTNGTPRARYSYDAYGELNGNVKAAAAANPFLYRGQYTDASTGLQYLRARYYDPSTGGFLTQDPLEESTGDTYSYAGGDPVNASDPTGLSLIDTISDGVAGGLDIVTLGHGDEVSRAAASFLDGASGGISSDIAGKAFGFDPACADYGSSPIALAAGLLPTGRVGNAANGVRTFHRLESGTQTAETAAKQRRSGAVWGRPNRGSDMPSVDAYEGPLPSGKRGIEFETSVTPNRGSPPGRARWYGDRPGLRNEDGFAKLCVRVTKNTQC